MFEKGPRLFPWVRGKGADLARSSRVGDGGFCLEPAQEEYPKEGPLHGRPVPLDEGVFGADSVLETNLFLFVHDFAFRSL
jgi:hypothetical protein